VSDLSTDEHLEGARSFLEVARLLADHDRPGDAVSRSYYGVLHATRAVLLTRDLHPQTHKGVHRLLGKVARDTLDTSFAANLWEWREAYDYELNVDIPYSVQEVIRQSETFVHRAEDLC